MPSPPSHDSPELRLRAELEAQLRHAHRIARLGAFERDLRTGVAVWSPELIDLLGVDPGDSPNIDSFLDLVHPDDRERARATIDRARAEGGRPYRSLDARGELVWIDERSTVFRDPDGAPRHLQGVIYDVTATRRREQELREAQRLESVGQLAGGVAHDFNNLLGVIQGYAELLEGQVDDQARADVAEIRRAAERAADLTGQLLLFARREPVEAEVVDVHTVLGELGNMLARIVGEHVAFRIEMGGGSARVRIPTRHLEQILVNLTVNARDAMPGGGTLSISVVRENGFVKLRVVDDGAGMKPEVAARAFDPFFTTKEKGRGTGLGLATVYGVVQQAGGRVRLASDSGKGTTVTIELPATEEETVAGGRSSRLPIEGRGETVMVLEDEPDVRELTGRMLAESGYRVLRARDGRCSCPATRGTCSTTTAWRMAGSG